MKITTAKQLSTSLHLYYVRCVTRGVHDDFGVTIPLSVIPQASKWWQCAFLKIVKYGYNDVNITTPAIFEENTQQQQKEDGE